MKRTALFIMFFLFQQILVLTAQENTVAIGEFTNESSRFYLDSWETLIPQYLQEQLSNQPGLTLLARRDFKPILDEQSLSLTGRLDSTTATLIGRLLSARYLINGSVHHHNGRIRVDFRIVHTATGRMVAESVSGPSADHLDKMMVLAGRNLIYQLTGRGDYRRELTLQRYPARTLTLAAAVLATATLLADHAYKDRRDDYLAATSLDDFDSHYDKANAAYKRRNVLIGITSAAATGALYCWLKNRHPARITAGSPQVTPGLGWNREEVQFGLSIRF